MAEVQLKNLEKRYDNDAHAVRGVTFTARDGEFVVLVGPSGCGKTTTLRMVAGLEEITSGDLFIDGARMNDREPKDRDVAMVFQNYALYPHMTVFENMAFPLKMRKVAKPEIKRQVEEAAKLLGIDRHLNKKPKVLSGGERQRVAVGRAIVRRPKVFLFDEPLSNLDAALRTQMRAELKRIQRRLGATMLYVTHDQVEAMTMGDQIAVMNKGELEQFGSPSEIYERPATAFVARFLGSPAMNLISGGIVTEAGQSFFVEHEGANKLRIPLSKITESRNVQLGIRPEQTIIESMEGSDTATATGKLILIEPIGSVTHYYIDWPGAAGGTLVASASQSQRESLERLKLGDAITLGFPAAALHLFDRDTGKRLV
ncbi:MAG: sn-glycerol-3-phosphate ABC transporter ATP-binding protein UgpC [Bacteroidota bacterium]|nr:sn-glycerol-3-phosphate ABC transporter ATP-binding protein UgpC [Bacteroidota bacterium]MDP4233469.1 sn-glycerol-3-phosphate ABC transporter ATP-binding protein UgpC [Bacteroidota bacterium]MDP4243347.1 sn-glycerol-3-phosphate ABC transporter ATP-binding protein UgpC [Bacteroidota bacterium]MDP4287967.1 sn-glycerol-3-phosphate ABC transporter ATP-binding protein UgpC [Bacteroidota bacterium]